MLTEGHRPPTGVHPILGVRTLGAEGQMEEVPISEVKPHRTTSEGRVPELARPLLHCLALSLFCLSFPPLYNRGKRSKG